jgi:hypothetical protein
MALIKGKPKEREVLPGENTFILHVSISAAASVSFESFEHFSNQARAGTGSLSIEINRVVVTVVTTCNDFGLRLPLTTFASLDRAVHITGVLDVIAGPVSFCKRIIL